jgi:hypothetical protein
MRSAFSDEKSCLQFLVLLSIASAVFLRSESNGIHGHILLSLFLRLPSHQCAYSVIEQYIWGSCEIPENRSADPERGTHVFLSVSLSNEFLAQLEDQNT